MGEHQITFREKASQPSMKRLGGVALLGLGTEIIGGIAESRIAVMAGMTVFLISAADYGYELLLNRSTQNNGEEE